MSGGLIITDRGDNLDVQKRPMKLYNKVKTQHAVNIITEC